MNYKNIIFDFGNVLARFNKEELLSIYCKETEYLPQLEALIFHDWDAYDGAVYTEEAYLEKVLEKAPEHLKKYIHAYFLDWHNRLVPILEIWDLVYELKEKQVPIYILSNAPCVFAENALKNYSIVAAFDGAVFSGPIQKAKPGEEIFHHLLDKFSLKAEECYFLDDREDHIQTALQVGMGARVFLGDVAQVRKDIGI